MSWGKFQTDLRQSLRRLVVKAFTAGRVEALRPRIEEITAEVLGRMAGESEVDLFDAFAFPLPIRVISELLGVDADHLDAVRDWSGTITCGARHDAVQEAAACIGPSSTWSRARSRRRCASKAPL